MGAAAPGYLSVELSTGCLVLPCSRILDDVYPAFTVRVEGYNAQLSQEMDLFSRYPPSAREAEIVVQNSIHMPGKKRREGAGARTVLRPQRNALRLAGTLTDDFYQASTLRHIIALCVATKAPDAKSLLKEVRIAFIRQKIVEAHPEMNF